MGGFIVMKDVQYLDIHIASNGKMKDEFGWKRSGLIEVLSQNLPGRTEENTKYLSQESRCPGRDENRAPPEYKSEALPFRQPVR
jgi:hypothetical protein